MKKTVYTLLVLLSFLSTSCELFRTNKETTALLEVNGKYLYPSDLQQIIPFGSSPEDSAQMAEKFIERWIVEALMYSNAQRNISNNDDINSLVERYRRSLYIHEYEQRLIAQRLQGTINEDTLQSFYRQYANQFPLRENLLKGILVVLPKDAPQLKLFREWLQKAGTEEKAIENIQNYVLQNAISYDLFMDKWVSYNEVRMHLPMQVSDGTTFLKSNKLVEVSDSLNLYMLKIEDYRLVGDNKPYEFARPEIESLVLNRKKVTFIRNFEQELFQKAIKDGTVKFYYKEK